MGGVRSTKLETEKRVFTIQGWIINGVPDYLILKNIEQQFKNTDGQYIKRRQSKSLLQKAYKIWHEEQEATIEQKRALKIAKLKQDIRSMADEYKHTPKGMAVKLAYEKEINKLEGIYYARQLSIQGDKDNPLILGDGFSEEKQKRIDDLIKKALSVQED